MTVEAFAVEAREFCQWARSPGSGPASARQALVRLASIYLAGLHLPPPWHPSLPSEPQVEDIALEEKMAIYAAASALPVAAYSVVFDPLAVPSEVPVVGDLPDDIADIYADILRGLRLYEAGSLHEALWEWGFNFRIHWGQHAASGIRTLHAFLAANEPDLLSAGA